MKQSDVANGHPSGHTAVTIRNARPLLKWAGGKQLLLKQYAPLLPNRFQGYHEPFIGAGAVYFQLWNQARVGGQVVLSDSNEELVNMYQVVRDQLEPLIKLLRFHQEHHSSDYFYQIRNLDRQSDTPLSSVERAARTIYLNRTCYNGLYRVNSRGQFNVPIGRYHNPRVVMTERLQIANQALMGVVLLIADFRSVVDRAEPGDFIYFDPPYDPVSKTASFTSYTAGRFGKDEQRVLASVFTLLSEKGCRCMLSNSHTQFIRDLYRDYRIEVVKARRAINANSSARGQVKEIVVLNY